MRLAAVQLVVMQRPELLEGMAYMVVAFFAAVDLSGCVFVERPSIACVFLPNGCILSRL
jgi:hypothetical protein